MTDAQESRAGASCALEPVVERPSASERIALSRRTASNLCAADGALRSLLSRRWLVAEWQVG